MPGLCDPCAFAIPAINRLRVLRFHLRENAHVRRDFVVVMMPEEGDERFAILWRDRLPLEQFARSRTIEDVREAFRRCLVCDSAD